MISTISILYVDDEQALLEIGKLYLEMTDEFEVITAPSASVALNLLKTKGIQAIVSDYQMPEMDGIEFLKAVREVDRLIPFILFTGRGREEVVIEALNSGADFYIQKGGDPRSQFAELSHKIHAAVEHRRADSQVTRLNQLYSVLSATSKAVTHIHGKKDLLEEICRIIVDIGGFRMAWAGIFNPDNHIIEPVASHGHSDRYLDTLSLSTEPADQGRGPEGTAFCEKKHQIVNDVATDPRMILSQDCALQRGYRSLAAFPFALDTRNAGVISVYASEPDIFNDQIIRLLEEQSADITYALATLDQEGQRITAENELRASELKYRRLFETTQDAILILDGESGEVIDANRFILDLFGYPIEYFIGKHLWELGFFTDRSLVQNAFTEVKTNGYIRYEDLPLRTKEGEVMNVELISNVSIVGDRRIVQCNIRDITEHKQAEEVLKENEEKYRNLVEHSLLGLILIQHCRPAYANPALLEISGHTADEIEALTPDQMLDAVHPEDRHYIRKLMADLLEGESVPAEYEFRIIRKDGKIRWILTQGKRISFNGAPAIQLAAIDITRRREAEGALQESEEKFRSIVDHSPFGVLLTRPDGEVLSANAAACQLFGRTENEIRKIGRSGLVDMRDPRVDAAIAEREKIGMIVAKEMTFIRKDGSRFEGEVSSSVFRDRDDKLMTTSMIVRDVTERMRTERALRESEVMYRSLVTAMVEGATFQDADGRITAVNPAAERINGRIAEEMMGRTSHDPQWGAVYEDGNLFPGELHPSMITLRTGEPQHDVVMGIHRPDGSLVWISINCQPLISDRERRPYAVVTTFHDITEKKRTEKALQKSEEKFRTVANYIYNWEYWVDLSDRIVYCSPSCERMTGYTHNEFSRDPTLLHEIVHPDDRGRFEAHVHEMETSSNPSALDFRIIRNDGQIRWIAHVCQNVYGDDGRGLGRRISNRDITDQKVIEESLRRNEERYRSLFNHAPLGIVHYDLNGVILDCNEKYAEIIGATREELIGFNASLDPKDGPVRDAFLMALETGTGFFEGPYHSITSGRDIIIQAFHQRLEDPQGHPTGAISIIEDISERKRMEDEIHNLNTYNRSLIEASLDPLVTITPKGVISDVNTATETVTGRPRDELIGTDFARYFSEPEKARLGYCQVFADGQVRDYPLEILHRDGHRTPVLYNASLYRDMNGETIGVFAAARDITLMKQMEEDLRESLAEKEVLLREVHHRVKNNLAGIISLINLQLGQSPDPITASHMKDLESRIRSMALVHESLYKAHDLTEIQFQTYCTDLVTHLAQSFNVHPEIQWNIDMADITLPLDAAIPCGMVVTEIVTNSLKYAFPGGFSCRERRGEPCTITMQMRCEDSSVVMTIADNGIGIARESAEQHPTTLGLRLIRLLAESQLQGKLDINTEQGTHYTIRFVPKQKGMIR